MPGVWFGTGPLPVPEPSHTVQPIRPVRGMPAACKDWALSLDEESSEEASGTAGSLTTLLLTL